MKINPKFRKKCFCKRCSFSCDEPNELEIHQEEQHGMFSIRKHKESRKGSRKLKESFLNKNKKIVKESVKPISHKIKKRPKGCNLIRCQNCQKVSVLFRNIKQPLQNLLLCPKCGLNVFKDNKERLKEFMDKYPEFKLSNSIDLSLVGYKMKPIIKKNGNMNIKRKSI